ncbi:MAG TPA: transcription termination/antitermination protein NusG [Firmicutes bacterium]|nr:transcription termination/antitermination protein NusG [Candidatus Fermentithermobacillaceae bacterium]
MSTTEEKATQQRAAEGKARWYVVHTYSGYENKVKANLEKRVETMNMKDKIFKVIVPEEEEIEYKEGKKKIVKRKVFPGYVVVNMIMSDDSWYVVRNTPGVTGFVGPGSKPIPLEESEVDAILKRASGEGAPKVRVKFKPGQSLRVKSGPFQGMMGVVQDVMIDRGKLRMLLSIFGRETPVELDFNQVEEV